MSLARPSTLALAALIDAPAIWHTAVAHDMPPSTALLRFLIAVPVSAAMLAILRGLTSRYEQPEPAIQVVAERLDTDDAGPAA
jgi:hypothetical protein